MYKKLLLAMALICASVATLKSQSVETVTTGLFEPYGVAVDPHDNAYYFTDSANNRLLRYHPEDEPTVSELSGFNNPQGIAYTSLRGGQGGALVLAETSSHRILIIPMDGGSITTIGGPDPGNSDAARTFRFPYGVAVDGLGNIYVADNQNGSIRKISIDNSVTTVATGFNRPAAVAVANNQIFVADTGNGSVVALDLNGNRVGSWGGFSAPRGLLWLGGQTGLLVSDASSHIIWSTGLGRVFAGGLGLPGNENSSLGASRFRGPTGIALDNNGHVIVADLFNSGLRSIKRSSVTAPVINFTSGFYSNAISISVTNKIIPPAAEFRYTTDGSDPSQFSTLLAGNALNLNGAQDAQAVIKIRGFSPDHSSSVILSNTYSFFVDAPLFNIPGGNFTTNINLAITTQTEGATLTYSNDLTRATGTWNGTADYGTSGLLYVQARKAGYAPSAVVTNNFGFTVTNPEIAPAGGLYVNEFLVTVTNSTPDTIFRYTLDGTTPTDAAAILPEGFLLNSNALAESSILAVRGFKPGYTNSATVRETYSLRVAPLAISLPAGEYYNHTNIFITTETRDVEIRYTVDGAIPTATTGSVWNNGEEEMLYGASGKLTARAFKNGYVASDPISVIYKFIVTPLTIIPEGGVFNNDVAVRFVNNTEGTVYRYTRNGTSPADSPLTSAGTVILSGNPPGNDQNELRVIGTKPGYTSTPEVSGSFTFNVADPVVTPAIQANGVFTNSVVIHAKSATTNAAVYYGLSGGEITNLFNNATGLTLTTTNLVELVALRDGYNDSEIIALSYPVQVDKPLLSPANGFFPSGGTVTVSIVRADARLYFTTDGNDPTTNSLRVPADGKIKINTLIFPLADLRTLKVRAFADNVLPSEVASGEVAGDNTIGIPSDLIADVGSEVVVPVVLNLKQNQEVRSFQFNVKVAAIRDPLKAVHNAGEISPLASLGDDLVVRADGSLNDGPSTNWLSAFTVPGEGGVITNGLSVYTKGTNSNFAVRDYGFVAMLKLNIPADAVPGDKYSIEVSNPSATEDGFQKDVPLTSLPARTITVQTTPYLVGDSSPSGWYNAGDFGNGKLDNSDVNNVLYASFGIRRPYLFSDLFNTMDAFPDPDPANLFFPEGGDGDIRLLDYQRVLDLSLKRVNSNYSRNRNSLGKRIAIVQDGLSGSPLSPAETLTTEANGNVWYREAALSGGAPSRVEPGQTAEIPVFIEVQRGKRVSGLMFRAQIVGINGAPAVTEGVSFSHNMELSLPQIIPMEAQNELAVLWDIGSINPTLAPGRKQLGTVSFKAPAGAKAGQAYRLQFAIVDGAPDNRTQYNLESFPAWVWINRDAPGEAPAISDEWKIRFFGSVNAVQADAMSDADNDGIPNWKEFLAGTNPIDVRSRLNLQRPEARSVNGKLGFALRFLSAPGKTYVIESSTNVANAASWTVVTEGVIGDGSLKEFFDSAHPSTGKFYRIRLQ
ncbi:MAG: chitobiase/beta-hexosaminidase C-terminal domain-containing protein [Verrucomicrobiales bacterium]